MCALLLLGIFVKVKNKVVKLRRWEKFVKIICNMLISFFPFVFQILTLLFPAGSIISFFDSFSWCKLTILRRIWEFLTVTLASLHV